MEILIFVIKTFATALIAAIAGGAIGWGKAKDKAHKEDKARDQKEREENREVLKTLIHSEYFRCCKELVDEPAVSDADYENFVKLHDSYTSLGMNGRGSWYYNQIKDKPKKSE